MANRKNKTGRVKTQTNIWAVQKTRNDRKEKWGINQYHMLPRIRDPDEHMEKATLTTTTERYNIQHSTNPEQTRREYEQNNINTWTHPDGQTQRQIDYITTNSNYRNAVTKACAVQIWRGNMAQQGQRNASPCK